MINNQTHQLYSGDYKPYTRGDVFRFKDYDFLYGPTNVSLKGNSRLASYKYLNKSGVEYEKIDDELQITVSGILINNLGEGYSKTAMYQASVIRSLHKDRSPGELVLPGLGTYTCIMQDYSLEETGDYQGDYSFSITFLEHTAMATFDRIVPSFTDTQESLPTEEQRNIEYTIVSGDTLSAIARKYGVTLTILKAWNPNLFDASHRNGNLIYPGEKVIIKKSTTGTESPSVYENTDKYVEQTVIAREEKLTALLENKSLKVDVPRMVGTASFSDGTVVSYKDFSKTQTLKKPTIPQTGKNIGNYFRDMLTTMQRKNIEKAKNMSLVREPETGGQSSVIFPSYGDLVEYPKDRLQLFYSVPSVKVINTPVK